MFKFIKKFYFLDTLLGVLSCFRAYYMFLLSVFLKKDINNIKTIVKCLKVIALSINNIIRNIFLILGKEEIINKLKLDWDKIKVRLDEKFQTHFIYIIVTFFYSLYYAIILYCLLFFLGKFYIFIILTIIFVLLIDYIKYKKIDIGITYWHSYVKILVIYVIITNLSLLIYLLFSGIIILGLFYILLCDFIKSDEKEEPLFLYPYETFMFFKYMIPVLFFIRLIIIPESFINQAVSVEIVFITYIMTYPFINYLKCCFGIRKNFFCCRKNNFTLYFFLIRVIIGIILFFIGLIFGIILFSYASIFMGISTGSEYLGWFLYKTGFLQYIQKIQPLQPRCIVFCDIAHLSKEDGIHLNIDNPLQDTEIEEPNITYNNVLPLPNLMLRSVTDTNFRFVKLNEVYGISESSYIQIIKNLQNNLRTNFLGNYTYDIDSIHCNNLTHLYNVKREGGSSTAAYCNFLDHMFPLSQYTTDRVVNDGATIHTFWNKTHNQIITCSWLNQNNTLNRVCSGIGNYYELNNIHLIFGTIHSITKTYFYLYAKEIHDICGIPKSNEFKDFLFLVTENNKFFPVSQKDTIYPQLMFYKLNDTVEKGMIVQGYNNMKGIIGHKDIKFNPVTSKWYLAGEDAVLSGNGLSLKDPRSFTIWNDKYMARQFSPQVMTQGKYLKNALGNMLIIN